MTRGLHLVVSALVVGCVVGAATAPPGANEPAAPSAVPKPSTATPTPVGSAPTRPDEHEGPPADERPKDATARYVVAAVGDSLTDYESHGGGFLRYLEKRCPESRFDNYGRGGKMVNQMRRRFADDVLRPDKPRYTHVIVFGGVNDLYSDETAGRTPKLIARDLLHMYDAARQRGMRVVAVTVTPWGGFKQYFNAKRAAATHELNRWILDQVDAGTVDTAIDAFPLLSCGNPEVLCPEDAKPFKDGLHFGPRGHEKIGKALHERVFSRCR